MRAGGCLVVVDQWQSTDCTSQVSWVWFPATTGLFTFLYFHLITSLMNLGCNAWVQDLPSLAVWCFTPAIPATWSASHTLSTLCYKPHGQSLEFNGSQISDHCLNRECEICSRSSYMDGKYLHFLFDIIAVLFTLPGTHLISILVWRAIRYFFFWFWFFIICDPYIKP